MTIIGKLGIFFFAIGIVKLGIITIKYFVKSRSEHND